MNERDDTNKEFGFEGFLRGIGDLMHQAAKLSSDMRKAGQTDEKTSIQSHMTIRTADGEEIGSGFFGLSEIVSRAKGRQSADESAPVPSERREVTIEVFSDRTAIIAVAEMVGANVDTLKIMVEENMLVITGEAPGIDYYGEALLPAAVDNAAREQSFRNGVLELRWPPVTPQS